MSEPWWVSPPGQSSDALVPVSVPGLPNNGPQREPNNSTPMDWQNGPTLIYQEGGEGKSFSTADVAVAAQNLGVNLNEISIDEDGTAHVTIGTTNSMSRSDVQALLAYAGSMGAKSVEVNSGYLANPDLDAVLQTLVERGRTLYGGVVTPNSESWCRLRRHTGSVRCTIYSQRCPATLRLRRPAMCGSYPPARHRRPAICAWIVLVPLLLMAWRRPAAALRRTPLGISRRATHSTPTATCT